MKPVFSRLIKIFLSTLGCLCATGEISLAQVTSDDTVNTQVEQDGGVAEITGGETRGSNLFHSFEDFSVPTNNEAFFDNAESIGSIFSRVTGGDVSNIDGAIRANGGANLFLINPAGIVFGENASLNIGGSFYGSTADSIIFPDGEFSATAPESESVLTVDVPIGLGFGSSPGDITNNSVANDGDGLEVAAGENITLVGGDIDFQAGRIEARGGTINLGGLSAAGEVFFNEDNSLSFPENIARGDISFSNAAEANVAGTAGGNINVFTGDLKLVGGNLGSSILATGVTADSTLSDAQAGDVTIDATNNISIDNSLIVNQVDPEATGNSGSIFITTNSLSLADGGAITISTQGRGNAGTAEINAKDTLSIDGESSQQGASGVFSRVAPEAEGDAGGVAITTGNLNLTDGGQVDTSTFGQGNAGSMNITVDNDILVDGENSTGLSSAFTSQVAVGATGNGGTVNVTTDSLSITNGGQIDASVIGQGNGGNIDISANEDIFIDGEDSTSLTSSISSKVISEGTGDAGSINIAADSLSLSNGGRISTSTSGKGNAGAIEITADDLISIDGADSTSNSGGIISLVNPEAEGNAGGVSVNTGSLLLSDGGRISTSTFGRGNSGSVEIAADKTIFIRGVGLDGSPSNIDSSVRPNAQGDAGGVSIETGSLSLTNGGIIDASIAGQGNGGNIDIRADNNISVNGENSTGISSGITSQIAPEAVGDSGDVIIDTGSLSLTNGGQVSSSVLGQGDGGNIDVMAENNISVDGENSAGDSSVVISQVAAGAEGDSGNVIIDTGSLSLTNGAIVDASTFGQGDAGSVEITAKDTITFDGEGSTDTNSGVTSEVAAGAEGDSGDVIIDTSSLSLTNGGLVSASTFGQGDAGSVEITAKDTITFDGVDSRGSDSGVGSQVGAGAEGDSGGVIIDTGSLSLTNGGLVSASTFGRGNAGSVEITARDSITADGEDSLQPSFSGVTSQVNPKAVGNAGGVIINTGSLSLTTGGTVSTSTAGEGNAGSIKINASDTISVIGQGSNSFNSFSAIASQVSPEATGDAGGITINADSLSLAEQGLVSTSTFGQGNAGQLAIKANSLSLDFGGIASVAESGSDGNINLQIAEDLTLENNSAISAQAFEDADGGNLFIDAKFIIASPNENNDLVASAEQGTGGNINIVSSGVFGLEERSSIPDNNTNDIDASSELGVDGTVNLNTNYEFLNSFELIEPEFAVAKKALTGSCFARRNSRQGSFVYGGTGGLPVSPDSTIDEEESYSSRLSRVKPNLPSPNPLEVNSTPTPQKWQIGDPIVEPTHLIKTADGRLLWINKQASRDSLACK